MEQRADRRSGNPGAGCPEMCRKPVDTMTIAMAYVPWQSWSGVYPLEKGWNIGTLFPELNKPFMGRRIG